MNNPANKQSGILNGVAWVGSSRLIVRLLGLCSTFVLARLLVPEDFGLVAVASGIIGLLEAFSEMGFNQALIRFQDADDQDYSTAWTLNLCRGLLLSVLLLALAYPLSLGLNDERLFNVFLVIACLPIFRGLENPRLVIYEKKMQFDVTFRVMVITKLAGVITTISLVFLWRSYWVLITGMIVTAVTSSLLSYFYAPGKISVTVKSWRKLFGFSGWLAGSQVFIALGQRLDPIILAAFSASHVVGVLHLARELSLMLFVEVAAPLRRVIFPALSNVSKGDSASFMATYEQSVVGLFLILSPICLGFSLVAPDAVPVLLGNQWLEVVWPIQMLSFFLIVSILGQLTQPAALAKGKSRPVFIQSIILNPLKIVIYTLCVSAYGLKGAIVAICANLVIFFIVNMLIIGKIINAGIFQHILYVKRIFPSLLIMFISVSLIKYFLDTILLLDNHFYRLFILMSVGIISYSLSVISIWYLFGKPNSVEKILLNKIFYYYTSLIHKKRKL